MTDREKVVKSLETAVKNFERYSGDEYGREYDYARVEVETLEDAIALLKAQEPMLVMRKDANEIIGDCPKCGRHVVHWHHKFCYYCGQAVSWT